MMVVMTSNAYSDDVGRHDQRNVNKNNKAFKIKLAVTMTSPEERQHHSYFANIFFNSCNVAYVFLFIPGFEHSLYCI